MDYLARIELDGGSRALDRTKLDAELAESQFYFIVMGDDGVTGFKLPAGTYYCYATYPDINSAHAAVVAAMNRSSVSGKLLVTAVNRVPVEQLRHRVHLERPRH